jgi:hypothetical protein
MQQVINWLATVDYMGVNTNHHFSIIHLLVSGGWKDLLRSKVKTLSSSLSNLSVFSLQ